MSGSITGEIIKSAIARNIRGNIILQNNEPFKIYKEKTVQSFNKPSFFIWVMDVSQRKLMRNNYERDYQMNIRFHTTDDNPKENEVLSDVGNKLLFSLAELNVPILDINDTTNETVEQNKPIKGKQMSFNIVDGVLQVFVTYTIKAKQVLAETPGMQELKIEDI